MFINHKNIKKLYPRIISCTKESLADATNRPEDHYATGEENTIPPKEKPGED